MVLEASPAAASRKRGRDEDDEVDSLFVRSTRDTTELADAEDEDDGLDDSDSEDDDDASDDEDATGPCEYEESSEPLPQCAAYDKDFTQVGEDLMSIPLDVIAIVKENGCESRRAQACRANAKLLTVMPRNKREKIALLGNTEAGKSSLLNSLLGMPKLAKSMAAGQSCTHVGTEYEGPFIGQTKKLAAKVEYFDIKAIHDLLERLLKDYNTWYCERPEDMDEDEEQELKRLGMTAFDTFRCLFCDKSEMCTPGMGHEYLQAALKVNKQAVFSTFSGWCEEMLEVKEADEDDHIEYLDADTQRELLAQLEPLVFASSKLDVPALWPLVKKVRLGITGPRILDYVVLVDLPGIDDTNKVRVDASLDIMRTCDSIWIVTKIDRAITDTTVDSLLSRYGKSYGMIVICTGIDDNVDPELASYLASEGQSIGEHDALRAREKDLRKTIKKSPKMIATRVAKLEGRNKIRDESKRRPLTGAARGKLGAQVARLEKDLDSAIQELPNVSWDRYVTLVDARNAFAIRRLKAEKAEYFATDRELQVFCVSNVHYSALKGARVVNGPRLDAGMTRIPALREAILRSAAPVILDSVERYIAHQFTVFMKGLAMWAKSYSVEGSSELLAEVAKPQDMIEDVLDAYSDDITEASEDQVTQQVREELSELVFGAVSVMEAKKRWNWSTIRAFVRRDGNHRTSVVPQQCWNEQFLEGAKQIVHKHWDDLIAKQEALGGQLKEDLKGLVKDIESSLAGNPAYFVLPMDRLRETFEAQTHGIEQACDDHQEALAKEMRNIKLDLTQDRPRGYFTQALGEAYEKAKEERGKGVKQRIINTFETHLQLENQRSPFVLMCDSFAEAVADETAKQNRALGKQTENILKGIYNQFAEIVDEKIDDPAERELRNQFVLYLRKAEPKFEAVKLELARIKRKYRVE